MHPHCCGSVPGRGIKHILKWVPYWLQNDKECRYFVKLDITNFFNSIDINILRSILKKKIKGWWIHDLWNLILESAPVPCPIGYYPSPWLGNLYLEELDWFIEQQLYKVRRGKRIKYVRHYLRYADDILLIGTSKADLEKAVRAIIDFLDNKRHVKVKNTWEIKEIGKHIIVDNEWTMKPGTYWCDIGGYKFCKDASVVRDGIFLSTRRDAKALYKKGYYTPHKCASINAKVAWVEKVGSMNFIENEIRPYVDIKTTRRIISDVDKNRKRRSGQT